MSKNCFIPQCREGYKSHIKKNKLNGVKQKTLFKAPKDTFLLEKWAESIPRSDRKLRPGIDNVCEKHFDESQIERYFETKMPDGSVHLIERERILLKKNAIPSIFPDLPQYMTTKKQIRKTTAERNVYYFNNNILNTIDTISETYNNLKDTLKNMALPNEWFFSCAHSSLVLGYLDCNYEVVKKIIISSSDLNLKIFIKTKLINIAETHVTCIEDLNKILKTVDDFKMCTGTGIDNCPKSKQCNEYVENELSLNQVQRCVECAKERKYNMDIQRVHKQKRNKKTTTKPVIKNVL